MHVFSCVLIPFFFFPCCAAAPSKPTYSICLTLSLGHATRHSTHAVLRSRTRDPDHVTHDRFDTLSLGASRLIRRLRAHDSTFSNGSNGSLCLRVEGYEWIAQLFVGQSNPQLAMFPKPERGGFRTGGRCDDRRNGHERLTRQAQLVLGRVLPLLCCCWRLPLNWRTFQKRPTVLTITEIHLHRW